MRGPGFDSGTVGRLLFLTFDLESSTAAAVVILLPETELKSDLMFQSSFELSNDVFDSSFQRFSRSSRTSLSDNLKLILKLNARFSGRIIHNINYYTGQLSW